MAFKVPRSTLPPPRTCRACRDADSAADPVLRAAHGHEIEASLSRYHLGHELERVRAGLEVAVDAEAWVVFTTLSLAAMAAWLLDTAAKADLRRYKKAGRGPKKAPVKRQNDPAKPTVSTARLLAASKGRTRP